MCDTENVASQHLKAWPLLPLILGIVSFWAGAGASQTTPADETLRRATVYMDEFVARFANVVAEEHYVQETSVPRRHREMHSDFLMVKTEGSNDWLQFRDVFEVDGQPVRDRQDRLRELFLNPPSADAFERAAQVSRESARYNLDDIGTLNRPLTAMSFLQRRYQRRFRFVRGPIDRQVGPEARLFQYEEWARPTILRSGVANGQLPAHGRIWIEESTGRVMQTQLLLDNNGRIPSEIVTSFAFDPGLQVIVPVEMRERYERRLGPLTTVATYTRFRRYVVQTQEQLR